MKTVLNLDDADMPREHYAECAANWSRPEADRFGTWHDWTAADVEYLLTELRNGHRELGSEKAPGWLLSVAGLEVAILANSTEAEDALPLALSALREGLHLGLDNATERIEWANRDQRNAIDRTTRILSIISEDPDACGRSSRHLAVNVLARTGLGQYVRGLLSKWASTPESQ